MKTFVSSCSSNNTSSSTSSNSSTSIQAPKQNLWHCFFRSSSGRAKHPFVQRAMRKSRLTDFCCNGASSGFGNSRSNASDEEERPMVSSCSSIASTNEQEQEQHQWVNPREQLQMPSPGIGASSARKRVMVLVDESRETTTALLWALSHVVHKTDLVTLLVVSNAPHHHICNSQGDSRAIVPEKTRLRCQEKRCELISSLRSLCSMRQPEVDVEIVVVPGEKGATIVRQTKKLDSSILVLGQKKLSFLQRCLRWKLNKEDQLADYCIQNSDCLTLSIRRKSKQCGGYLINSKWQKNFWLLA